jgi:hypothetical protein
LLEMDRNPVRRGLVERMNSPFGTALAITSKEAGFE